MNIRRLTHLLAGIGLVLGSVVAAPSAETNRAPAALKLSPQEFQEKLKAMTPEERPAAIRAYREQLVREAQQRPRIQQPSGEIPPLTPQEAEARQKQMRARLETRVADLAKKQAAGTLTPQEETQLEKLQMVLRLGPEAFSGNARRREMRPPDSAPKIVPPRTNPPPASPGSASP